MLDAGTGEERRRFRVPGGATLGLAFHPAGQILATGSRDGSVQTWRWRTGEAVGRLREHDDYVRELAFSPDGSLLVSASGDTTLRVFDTLSPRERFTGATGP